MLMEFQRRLHEPIVMAMAPILLKSVEVHVTCLLLGNPTFCLSFFFNYTCKKHINKQGLGW